MFGKSAKQIIKKKGESKRKKNNTRQKYEEKEKFRYRVRKKLERQTRHNLQKTIYKIKKKSASRRTDSKGDLDREKYNIAQCKANDTRNS